MRNQIHMEPPVVLGAKNLPDADEEEQRNEDDDEEEESRRQHKDEEGHDEIRSDDMRVA
jgi:hypothetical protein